MRVGIEKMDTLLLIVRKSSLDHLFVVSFFDWRFYFTCLDLRKLI